MSNAGSALMGIGFATGEKRAVDAAHAAINSPLLDVSITGARGVLFAIAGGDDMTMHEIQEAAKVITESVDPEARVIFGAIKDSKLKKDEVKVTVIASGFPESDSYKTISVTEEDAAGKDKGKEVKKELKKEVHNPAITPQQTPPSAKTNNEDEDDWNAIPAFLRRKK